MNATKEIPPRQYSGYQYQIVFSSYFSAWLRGNWRWSVSMTFRVRSAHGVVGKRSFTHPNSIRFVCRRRLLMDCRSVMAHRQYAEYHSGWPPAVGSYRPSIVVPVSLIGMHG